MVQHFPAVYICFQGKYIIVGRYRLSGVACINNFSQGTKGSVYMVIVF